MRTISTIELLDAVWYTTVCGCGRGQLCYYCPYHPGRPVSSREQTQNTLNILSGHAPRKVSHYSGQVKLCCSAYHVHVVVT